jgi:hypothetical protein
MKDRNEGVKTMKSHNEMVEVMKNRSGRVNVMMIRRWLTSLAMTMVLFGCGQGVSQPHGALAPGAEFATMEQASHGGGSLRVLAWETFAEKPELVAALVKLRGDLDSGAALSIEQGIDHAVKAGERLRLELGDRLKIPAGVKQSFVNQFKYQLKNGQLALSIYTVLEGKGRIPELSHTVEHLGSPSVEGSSPWVPKVDVFGLDAQDDVHVGRSAAFLALLQTTRMSLQAVAERAGRYGFVYRVEPEVYFREGNSDEGVAAFNILLLDDDGETQRVKVAIP